MRSLHTGAICSVGAVIALSSLGGCDSEVRRTSTSQLAIEVSPLSLTGVTEVYYHLAVVADDALVWEQVVTSTQNGKGTGGLT